MKILKLLFKKNKMMPNESAYAYMGRMGVSFETMLNYCELEKKIEEQIEEMRK